MDIRVGVHTMTLVRRIVLTLVAALVVLVGAATAEAANPVVAAAKRTADARSSVFDMQMNVEAGGQKVAVIATGAMRGQDSAKLTMRTTGPGANTAIDMRMLREAGRLVMYMILGRSHRDPTLLPRQLRQYRNYLELLFARWMPAKAVPNDLALADAER